MTDFTSLPCELGPIGELPFPVEPIDGGSIDGPIDSGNTPVGPFEPAPEPIPIPPTTGGGGGGTGTGIPTGPSTGTPTPIPPVGPSTGPIPIPPQPPIGGTGPSTGTPTPAPNPIPIGPSTGGSTGSTGSTGGATGATTGGEGPTTPDLSGKGPSIVYTQQSNDLEGYEYTDYSNPNSQVLGVDNTYYNTGSEANTSILTEDSILTSMFNTMRDSRINKLIQDTSLTIKQLNDYTASMSTTTIKDSLRQTVVDVLFGLHTPDGRPYAENELIKVVKERIKDFTIDKLSVDYLLTLKSRSVLKSSVVKQNISILEKSQFGTSKRNLNIARNTVSNRRAMADPPILPNKTRAILRAQEKNKPLDPNKYTDLNSELLKLWYILPEDIYRRLEVNTYDGNISPIYIKNDDTINVETSSGEFISLPIIPFTYQLSVTDTNNTTVNIDTNSDINRAVTLPNISEQACLFDAGSEYRTTLEVGIPGEIDCKILNITTSDGDTFIKVCNNLLEVQTSSGDNASITTLPRFLEVDTTDPDALVPLGDFTSLEFFMDPLLQPEKYYLLELLPNTVEDEPIGSTILNRKTNAKYRLIVENTEYIQNLIKYRVYPWKVFPIDYNDPILGYFDSTSEYSFIFNSFSMKSFGETHGENIFVRRIPKIIVILPTDKTSYNFFHNFSLLVSPNVRRINFGALPEPDYYNTGLDKHWLKIKEGYPEPDIFGELNPNSRYGEYSEEATLLNSGMTLESAMLRQGFRAAYDIALELADTYYLDGGLLWSDIYQRMTKEEYTTFDRGIPEDIINAFMAGAYTGIKIFHNSTGKYRLETRLLGLRPGKVDNLPYRLVLDAWQG